MADPALDYPLPDVLALVQQTVHVDGIADPAVYLYATVPLPGPTGWFNSFSVEVDVRARSAALCQQRADDARRKVLGLPWATWDGGAVVNVVTTYGPNWQPDQNGQPCYVARYEVHAHPNPRTTQRSPARSI